MEVLWLLTSFGRRRCTRGRGSDSRVCMSSAFPEDVLADMRGAGLPVALGAGNVAASYERWEETYGHVNQNTSGLIAVKIEGRCRFSADLSANASLDCFLLQGCIRN